MRMSPEGEKFRKVPPFLLENLMFPYTQGAEFVEEMQKKPSQRSLHQGKQTLHQLKQWPVIDQDVVTGTASRCVNEVDVVLNREPVECAGESPGCRYHRGTPYIERTAAVIADLLT